jgi:hypothetical protein
MSKVFYKLLWIKVCYKSEAPRRAKPRELKRPKRLIIVKISCHFFSSDHGGISSVVAIATPVPRSGILVMLVLIVLKEDSVAFILNGI